MSLSIYGRTKIQNLNLRFYNKLINGILNVDGTFYNISESESRGMEVSSTKKLKHLFIDVSASYVKSRDLTNKIDYNAFPRYTLNLGLGY